MRVLFCLLTLTLLAAAASSSLPSPSNAKKQSRTLAKQEMGRWAEAMQEAKSQGYKVKGFYHTSTWQTWWRDVIEEQLLLMDGYRTVQDNWMNVTQFKDDSNHEKLLLRGSDASSKTPLVSSLFGAAGSSSSSNTIKSFAGFSWGNRRWTSVLDDAELYLNVAGRTDADYAKVKEVVNALPLKNRKKITLHFDQTIDRMVYRSSPPKKQREFEANPALSEGEVSTMTALHDYCRAETAANRKAVVFYLHNKGGCCSRRPEAKKNAVPQNGPVASWREAMNAFTIEFPSICLRALVEGYATCGFEYQIGMYHRTSSRTVSRWQLKPIPIVIFL